jgi:glutathione S-transferase
MRLFQIPFSHNCVKVRHVLDLKGIPYETTNINPLWRPDVMRASGQFLVPALVDEGRAIVGSTQILLHIEERHPRPPLLPADPRERAECLLLMDWADATFMALTRRIAYHQVLEGPPTDLGGLFFPGSSRRVRTVAGAVAGVGLRIRFGITAGRYRKDVGAAHRAAAIAVERIGEADHLVGDRPSLADITLATMSAPLQYASEDVTRDETVRRLLAWDARVLGGSFSPPRVTALAAPRSL